MSDVQEITYVGSRSVACDGGGGALGHPRVFLAIDPRRGLIDCPYCGRRFVLDPARAATEPPAS
jgi:uncharacterized Zn-finger protein